MRSRDCVEGRAAANDAPAAMVTDIRQASAALRDFVSASRLHEDGKVANDLAVGDLLALISEWVDAVGDLLRVDPVTASPADLALHANETESTAAVSACRSGLAPWQIRRVILQIEANLDAVIRIEELARLSRLSTSHFMRAFRMSFGDSPHRFIMRRRTERAQGLMLTTNAPLGQIALECGLADQSHLTRLFQRFVGEAPGTWRKSRVAMPGC